MNKDEAENLFTPALKRLGYEAIDLKLSSRKGKVLIEVFIDHLDYSKPGQGSGINFDDCQKASAALGEELDIKMPELDGYFLEVSSPGLNRLLKKEKDFNRFAGSAVKLRLKQAIEGTKIFYGDIIKCEGGKLYLSGNLEFKLSDIAEARLHYSEEDILKRK